MNPVGAGRQTIGSMKKPSILKVRKILYVIFIHDGQIWGGFAGLLCLNAVGILAATEHKQNGEKEHKKPHWCYSITSSARMRMDSGTSIPRVFAVFILTTI
jgi:hypothetical protein